MVVSDLRKALSGEAEMSLISIWAGSLRANDCLVSYIEQNSGISPSFRVTLTITSWKYKSSLWPLRRNTCQRLQSGCALRYSVPWFRRLKFRLMLCASPGLGETPTSVTHNVCSVFIFCCIHFFGKRPKVKYFMERDTLAMQSWVGKLVQSVQCWASLETWAAPLRSRACT